MQNNKNRVKTPLEKEISRNFEVAAGTLEMQAALDKFGGKTACGGTVWTAADLARFFKSSKMKKRLAALKKLDKRYLDGEIDHVDYAAQRAKLEAMK
jgi:hypothetical protein